MERVPYSLLPLEENPGLLLRRRQLHKLSRRISRLYYSGYLAKSDLFDNYHVLGENMCQKITTDLNSVLQHNGFVVVIDSYNMSDTNQRNSQVQVLAQQAYLRVVNPTWGLLMRTEQILHDAIISTRITRSERYPSRGALDFDVRTDYGQGSAFILAEKTPQYGFAIVTIQDGVANLLLDTSPSGWKVNGRVFA